MRVHGLLRVIDKLTATGLCCPDGQLIAALESWRENGAVFMAHTEIDKRLRNLRMEQSLGLYGLH